MLNPGDLVIHPHDTHRLAMVILVSANSAVLEDEIGRLTVRTETLVALTTNPRIRAAYAF